MSNALLYAALAGGGGAGDGITGELRLFAGRDADFDGWLLCDGRLVMTKDYPELYSVIKTDFGYDEEAPPPIAFRLPDARGKVAGACSDTYTQGKTVSLGSGGQLQTLFIGNLFIHV